MASHTASPVAQPLPRIVVQLGLTVCFVLGHILLWNDRRVGRAALDTQETLVVPAYK